jgi:hypothetical protein
MGIILSYSPNILSGQKNILLRKNFLEKLIKNNNREKN